MNKTFSIKEAIKFGWNQFIRNWKFWVIAFLIAFGVSGTSVNFPTQDKTIESKSEYTTRVEGKVPTRVLGAQTSREIQKLITSEILNSTTVILLAVYFGVFIIFLFAFSLLAYAVKTVVQMGLIHLCVDAASGNTLDYRTLLSDVSIRKAWRFIGLSFLQTLIIILGYIFFVIPGIYFSLKYMFASYIFVDKNTGIKEALKLSSELTKGVKFKLLGFVLTIFFLNLISLIVFVVGIVPISIVSMLATAYVYTKLKDSLIKSDSEQVPTISQ